MTPMQSCLTGLLFSCILPMALAATVVQCEDENGNRSFQDYCPAGSKEVGQKVYTSRGGSDAGTGQASDPLTLYMTPNCDSCNQLREFLEYRKIPIDERNVDNNAALQEELKERAGALRVPVLMVGDKALSGFNREALLETLTAAGYISSAPEEAAEAPAAAEEPAAE